MVALVAVTTVGLLLCACASREPRTLTRPTSSVSAGLTRTSLPANRPTNLVEAQAETRRLIGLVRLPRSRARLPHVPKTLSGPGMGVPVGASVVDTFRLWRVQLPFNQARAWMRAHPPAGLIAQGQSSSQARGVVTSVGFSFSDPDTAAWINAELDITLAWVGSDVSDWRIDGQAEWLDPAPLRDTASGRRIHLTLAGGCPRNLDHATDVTNLGVAALDRTLLPAARPEAALVCSYADPFGAQRALAPRRTLDAAVAGRVADDVRAISVSHVRGGVTNCPAMTDAVTIIALRYRSVGTVDLWWSPTGCASITTVRSPPGAT